MPAPYVLNRVKQHTLVEGIEDAIILTALPGRLRFADFLIHNDRVFYYIDDSNGGWESGFGPWDLPTDSIEREGVISSSNGNQKVPFEVGTKIVTSALDAKVLQMLLALIPSPPW